MAKITTAYADDTGVCHATPEGAALADLTHVLGRIGAESGLTAGLAKLILDRRQDIERIYADLDNMMKGDMQ